MGILAALSFPCMDFCGVGVGFSSGSALGWFAGI